MYNHPATKANIQTLKKNGTIVFQAASGDLASGLEGVGRLQEPEIIVKKLKDYFKSNISKKKLRDKLINRTVIITAGPTQEPLDPVRFISNYSSGKMGYYIAEELAGIGAKVILISGPTDITPGSQDIEIINVNTAEEMYRHCKSRFKDADGALLVAAVSDYKPKSVSNEKIKSSKNNIIMEFEKTVDIAEELGKMKNSKQFLAGFALESEDEIKNAHDKMVRKNFDFIVLNSLRDQGAGFRHETNKITIIDRNNKRTDFELKQKKEVALDVIFKIAEII